MGWAVRSRPQLHRRFGSRRAPVRPGSGRGRCVRGVGGRARGVLGTTRSLSPDPGRLPEARAGQLPPPVSEVVMEVVMKICLRAPAWAAVLCLATRVATTQVIPWPRGDRLVADARVDSARYDATGGVLLLRYTLTIDPASEQHARVFVVQARAPVVSVRAPEPAHSWVTVGPQPGDSIAFWGSASRQQDVAPGVSRPGFELRARGLQGRSEEHTSELQSHSDLVCRLLLEKKNKNMNPKQSSSIDRSSL